MEKKTEEKNVVNIHINGGNNQILPTATHAEQHFHYHTTETMADEPACVRIYDNVYVEKPYILRLRQCITARDLAEVVADMVRDPGIAYLDDVLAVKAEFILSVMTFCMNLRRGTSISNLRTYINKALATKPNKPYGMQI